MARLFATQLPLDSGKDLEKLLEVSKKWLIGSQHCPFKKESDFAGLKEHGDIVKKGEYSLELGKAKAERYSVLGLRYKNPDQMDARWTTEIVGTKNPYTSWVSVTVDFDTGIAGSRTPACKKPYILGMILNELGGDMDGNIHVNGNPFPIKDGDEAFVAEMLKGNTASIMPIIYVSRNDEDILAVEPNFLAKKLAGIGNVLVEPSRDFSFKLREHSGGYNVFGGAVGIFWPEGYGRTFWLQNVLELESDPFETISRKVIEGLQSRRIKKELTWENIQSLHNKEIIEGMKKSLSTDTDTLMKIYLEELEGKDKQIGKAEERISTLENELRKLSHTCTGEASMLQEPQVVQLYKDEVRGAVIDSVRNSLKQTPEHTRKREVLASVAALNNYDDSERKEMVNKIKLMFNDYTGMTGQMKTELSKMGFEIEADGKHYKMYIEGKKGGISVSISKTPSDWRTGKNTASEIVKTFF